ncbi:MAG: GNAT family N-acetyltransferase [Candidatus Asgardarchaeia archaeon]
MILKESIEEKKNVKIWQMNIYDEYEIYLIATATVFEYGEMAEIKYINVSREFRGQGIGSKLLAKITLKFQNKDLIVETFKERISWYKRFGFKVIMRQNNVFLLKKETISRSQDLSIKVGIY